MNKLIRFDIFFKVLLISGIVISVAPSPAISSTIYTLGDLSAYTYYGSGWNTGSSDVTVDLGTYLSSTDTCMATWTSPINGSINISGDAYYISGGTANVYLQLVPFSLASSLNLENYQQIGTTPLANGSVEAGYSSKDNKSYFGSTSIPLRDVSSLTNLSVQQGDVIVIGVQAGNIYTGSQVGVDLTIAETAKGSPVPIPSAILLFGTGLAGLAGTKLKRKKQQESLKMGSTRFYRRGVHAPISKS